MFGALSNYDFTTLPEEISNPEALTVSKCAVGEKHMLALLSNGVLLMCGQNDFGQLGIDNIKHPEVEEISVHPLMNQDYEIEDIGCGLTFSVFLVRT